MSRPSGRHALLGILLVASAAFLLYSVRSGRPRVRSEGGPAAGVAADTDGGATRVAQFGVPDDVDFSRYEKLAETNVFSGRRSAPRQQAQKNRKVPPTPPPIKPAERSAPRSRQQDFNGWTYAGYIAIDGEKRGILQNESSDSYKDVPVGGEFLGATVEEVTGERIVLRSGGSRITLSIPELFPIVPLDKGASGGGPARPRPR